MKRLDIIHPRERLVALPLYMDSNLRDLSIQTGNVQKTSFSFGRPYKWCTQPLDSICVLTRPALTVISHCWPPTAWTGLVGYKFTHYFKIYIDILQKIALQIAVLTDFMKI